MAEAASEHIFSACDAVIPQWVRACLRDGERVNIHDDTDMLLMYMGKPHSGKYSFGSIIHGINLAQGDKLLVQVFPAGLLVDNALHLHRPRKVQSMGASEPRKRNVAYHQSRR